MLWFDGEVWIVWSCANMFDVLNVTLIFEFDFLPAPLKHVIRCGNRGCERGAEIVSVREGIVGTNSLAR